MNAANQPNNLLKKCPEILSETLATLVLYNTSLENSPTFQSLGKALKKMGCSLDVFIYDNSLHAQKVHSLEGWSITYFHNSSNPGVSKAYNAGFELAKRKNKKWLLLFDQDTEYPETVFEDYCTSFTQHADQNVFVPRLRDQQGMVSPLTFSLGGGQRVSTLNPGVYNFGSFKFHNCGAFISIDAFEKAGGYDEQLPLDFSDFSFHDRLKKDQAFFVITATLANHSLASTSHTAIEERLHRFKSYCRSCHYYQQTYRPFDYLISFRLLLRSLKLSWRYRTFQFFKIYLNS